MKHFLPANAYNTFGRSTNEYGAGFAPEFSQGSVGLAGDSISFGDALAPFSQPDFVKIDVDGNELKVVQGMPEKLRNARYLCIELSKTHPETPQTLDIIASLGFTEMADADLIDTSREKGGIQNHYFENVRIGGCFKHRRQTRFRLIADPPQRMRSRVRYRSDIQDQRCVWQDDTQPIRSPQSC
jgi:hypothetical protein